MKLFRFFSLSISLIMLLLVASVATDIVHAQDPAPSVQAAIEAALAKAVVQRPAGLLPGSDDFVIDHLGVDGTQAYIIANRWPAVIPQDAEVVSPDILLAVARHDSTSWIVYLQGSSEFATLLAQISPKLLEPEARDLLLEAEQASKDISGAATPHHFPGLPWQAGQTWILTQGLHGSNKGLDFAPSGGSNNVYTADRGVLVGARDTCIQIKNPSGIILGYQHIHQADVATWREKLNRGETKVKYQEFVGRTTTSPGCNGTTSGHHVHLYFGSFNPIGSTLNGWKLIQSGNRTPLSKSGKTVYAALNMSAAIYFDPICAGCPLPSDGIPSSPGHFPDIAITHPFYPYIEALYAIGAVKGYNDGTYRPDESLTRGSVAKVIILAIGKYKQYKDGQCAFVDVCPDHSFYHYIRRAKELKIISGFSDGTYKPDNSLTRGALAKIIIRGRGENPNYSICQAPFPDVPCDHGFYHYIRRLKEIFSQKGASIGYSDGTYRPDIVTTRGDMTKLIVIGSNLERHIPIFYDVLYDNPFYQYIQGIAKRNITSGCSKNPPLYCFNDPLTRGQTAKFIIRGLGEEPKYTDGIKPFSDVSTTHTFYHYIRRLKALGISNGFPDGTYKPNREITRAEIARFIVRALKTWGITCKYNKDPGFSDVPSNYPFYKDIQCLKELGITSGFSNGTYRPDQVITRGQASKFIYLAFVQRTPVFPQEASNKNNGSCNSGAPTYKAWAQYIVPGIGKDRDCLKLQVTSAGSGSSLKVGQPYRLGVRYTGVNANLRIEVLSSNGTTVLAKTQGQGWKGSISLNWTPPKAGTYYMRLSNTRAFAKEGVQAYVKVDKLTSVAETTISTIYLPIILYPSK